MFRKYDRNAFSKLNTQHNIMVLVGNGFDTAVLKKYKKGKLEGKTTSYKDFYEYITYHGLSDESNVLYKKMKEDKEHEKEEWSDFENSLQELAMEGKVPIEELEKCVDEFQGHFTRFLNDIVDSEVLLDLNVDARKNQWATQSMGCFSKDFQIVEAGLEFTELSFVNKTNHHDLFNYIFVNFNYTYLLDNYINLDKEQFDPHCWKNTDTNFGFYLKFPGFRDDTRWSSYILYDVIHPHGTQNVPRSMLFGIDIPEYDKGRSIEKRLIKSYWAQYEIKYKHYMEEAELFIIFGMSLGKADAWWFDNIYDALLDRDAELIIYMYTEISNDEVKQKFIDGCIRHQGDNEDNIEKIKKRIYVKTFTQNDTYFLGFKEKKI